MGKASAAAAKREWTPPTSTYQAYRILARTESTVLR